MTHPRSANDVLNSVFGYQEFRGTQEAIIERTLADKHSLVLMPTGGGKSMCYQLPALLSEGLAIVVSPLIALMKNQVDAIRGISNQDGIAHVLNSTLTKDEQEKVKDDVKNGVTKLLYMAPESLSKDSNIEFLKSNNILFEKKASEPPLNITAFPLLKHNEETSEVTFGLLS